MARVKTFANNVSLLPDDLNSIEDDYETFFARYKPLWSPEQGNPTSLTAAGTIPVDGYGDGFAAQAAGTGNTPKVPKYFDPAHYAVAGRTLKLRVHGTVQVNAVAPGQSLTVGFYPTSITFGGSGTTQSFVPGTVTAGSTTTVSTPAANSLTTFTGPDFTAPAAGFYIVAFAITGAVAAGCTLSLHTQLQYRHV